MTSGITSTAAKEETMSRAKPFLGIAAALALASGCNREAFVSHLSPSSREFTVSADGDSVKVRFGSMDWHVSEIFPDGGTPSWRRSGEREMTVYFQPNFSYGEMKTDMVVYSQFERDTLSFIQNGGAAYEVAGMAWGTPRRTGPEHENAWLMTSVANDTPDTLEITLYPFAGAVRQVAFSDESGLGRWRKDLDVPVPDAVLDNGELSFIRQSSVLYSYDTAEYAVDDRRSVIIKVPPLGTATRDYGVLWDIDAYTVDYRLSLRNVDTGHVAEIDGRFTSKSPNGGYRIFHGQK